MTDWRRVWWRVEAFRPAGSCSCSGDCVVSVRSRNKHALVCLLFLSPSQASGVFILPCLGSPLGMSGEMRGLQLCPLLPWCVVVVAVHGAEVLMLKLQQIHDA